MKSTLCIFSILILSVLAACSRHEQGHDESTPVADDALPRTESEDPVVVDPVVVVAEPTEIVPGLSMRILTNGSGGTAEPGQTVVVHYTGWLYDPDAKRHRGQQFDSSVDRGQPFEFPLGAGAVIRGWDQGVAGMRIGEVRELTIAPELAYGERGAGGVIPPEATLVFEVELLDLRPPESGTG